jgi:hypothetical protein
MEKRAATMAAARPRRGGIAPSDRAAVVSFPAPSFLRSSWIKGSAKNREMFAETALDK